MTVNVYKSTDASAPTLSGSAGSLNALLMACLVSGYGTKTAAGWSNPYNGTNQAVFRPGSGVQHYFAIDDSGPNGTATTKEAWVNGYETMSAWATGTQEFPPTAGGTVIRKSSTADATARPWIVIADDRTCYVMAQTGDAAGVYLAATFGEFYGLLASGDNFRSLVIARATQNSSVTTSTAEVFYAFAATGTQSGHYMPRTYTGLGSPIAFGKNGDPFLAAGAAYSGAAGLTLPDPDTGAVVLSPIRCIEASGYRGRLRGAFQPCHSSSGFADGDTITGSGAYSGRSFLIVKQIGNSGAMAFDITGPWETN